MLTIENAIMYATDHGCKVSDDFTRKGSKQKAFYVSKDGYEVMITQCYKGARAYRVNGETYNRAQAIVTAVNYFI